MRFQFTGSATLTGVSLTSAKAEDAVPAVHVTFAIEDMAGEAVAVALGYDSAEDAVASLFRVDDKNQSARALHVKVIKAKSEWRGQHSLRINGSKAERVARIRSLQFLPRGKGLCDCAFTATIDDPPPGFVDTLKDSLKHAVKIQLVQPEDLVEALPATKRGGRRANLENGELPLSNPKQPKPAKKAAAKKTGAKKRPAKKGTSVKKAAANAKAEPRADAN